MKTTIRYYFIPARMTIIRKSENNQCWQRWREIKTSYTVDGNAEFVPTLENSLAVPQKVKNRVSIWPSNSTLRHIPWGMKIYVHTKSCTPLFIAALFVIAKRWKKCPLMSINGWMIHKYPSMMSSMHDCPPVNEWIHKMWCIHTTDYYLAIKMGRLKLTAKGLFQNLRKKLHTL